MCAHVGLWLTFRLTITSQLLPVPQLYFLDSDLIQT